MTQTVQASAVITHDVGLHARPSVKLTKLAKEFSAKVEIAIGPLGPWIDAKSIVKVMGLKARQNSELHVRAMGDDAAAAVSGIISLIARDFDEGENHAGA